MGRSIQVITPPDEHMLRMMSAHVRDCWSRHSSSFHLYAHQVCRTYPQAEHADKSTWERIMGTIPRPISEDDPKNRRKALEAKLRDLGPQPTDPSSVSHWLYSIEQRRLLSGVEVKYASPEQAIAGGRQDMLEALEMRDRWRLQQAVAQANSIDDSTLQGREAQREALAKVEALAERLAAERDEAMARLKNPAPEQAEVAQ